LPLTQSLSLPVLTHQIDRAHYSERTVAAWQSWLWKRTIPQPFRVCRKKDFCARSCQNRER